MTTENASSVAPMQSVVQRLFVASVFWPVITVGLLLMLAGRIGEAMFEWGADFEMRWRMP